MKKRLLAALLAVVMVFTMIPTVFAATQFVDVKTGAWYADAVEYVSEAGLMSGTGGGKFSPSMTTDRGMIVSILWRMAGYPIAAGEQFSDVAEGAYYANAVLWAANAGIASGYNGKFSPTTKITLEQLAQFLFMYAQHEGMNAVTLEENLGQYADANQISPYAVTAMNWAVGQGLITGNGAGLLAPKDETSRAQLAVILMNFCELLDGAADVEAEEYTVTFEWNYGSKGEYDSKSVESGDTVRKPRDPERKGYEFLGWYTKESGGKKFDFDTEITEDISLYARWAKEDSGHSHSYKNWTYNGDRTHTGTCRCGRDITEDCILDRDNICVRCGTAYPEDAFDLQAALEKGGLVVLSEDITATEMLTVSEDVEVVLDLNGKTLTGSLLAPKADLTVKNGTIKNPDANVSAIEINAGELMLNDVNIESARHAVRIDGAVEAVVDGGTYKVTDANVSHHTINVSGSAVVTIQNATIYGPAGTEYADANGGSAVQSRDTAVVTIESGNFSGGVNSTLVGNAPGNLVVTGGTFDQDPTAYVPEGCKVTDNGDGTWTVRQLEVTKEGVIYDGETLCGLTSGFEGTTLKVREGTTEIGYQALKDSKVTTVILPEGLKTIGYQAFSKTTNLTSVNIPSTVTTIGEQAFRLCGATEITVPASVTTIEVGAFRDMPKLATITFEGDNVVIPNYVCRTCPELTTVYIFGDNVTFSGTSMAFTHADTGAANGIIIYVANETVAEALKTAQGSAHGYTIVVADQIEKGVLQTGVKSYEVISKEGLMNLDSVLTNANPNEANILTVDLNTDIDLTGETWNPINKMWIIFNGNGHTISNMTTDSVWRAGFFGYAGAVSINDLTIKNADVTGSQAGIFAGSGEGFKMNNCVVEGDNTVTFAATEETWNGIGAITGLLLDSTINAAIASDATVELDYNDMTTAVGCKFVDELTGFISTNKGEVTVTDNDAMTTKGKFAYVAATAESLITALLNGTDVTLTTDISAPLSATAIYGTPVAAIQKGGILDGNGHSLDIENPQYNGYAIETYGGTIKNLTIDSTVGRGIVISSPDEDIYIDRVVIDGPGYAINTSEHNGKKLIVTDSTINGWTSFAGLESASFTNCTFGENTAKYWQDMEYDQDYDRLIKPYVNAGFSNCEFENGFYVDLSALGEDCTVTLTACTCNGVTLTAENYSQYITVELPNGKTLADCVIFA